MTRAQRLEWLHARYAGVLYDCCLRILRDSAEAEDAVQDTFVKAYGAIDRFEGDRWLPWLYRIATRTAISRLRKRRRFVLDTAPDPVGQHASPEARVGSRQVLLQLVATLDERNALIVVAHYLHGMSQGEIAEWLGMSRRAVVKRLTRIRTQLQPAFSEEPV